MSIALEGEPGSPIQQPRFVQRIPCFAVCDSAGSNNESAEEERGAPPADREDEPGSCSSSSSIGKDSDVSRGGSSDGDDEAESSCKGGPLSCMEALEDSLPIRRGISKFYNGKSKSFTSLADASSSSSMQDLAKPENPYNRKRKILLAHSNFGFKNRANSFGNISTSGTQKRPANSYHSTLPISPNDANCSSTIPRSPSCLLPPLHPHARMSKGIGASLQPTWQNPCRSLSLTDLQSMASSTPNITALSFFSEVEDKKIC